MTFNIHDGWGFGLTQAIRAVHIRGLDLIILTETKITDWEYCHSRLGYNTAYLSAITADAGREQGGVGLVVQDRPKE